MIHEPVVEQCKRVGFRDLYTVKCSAYRRFETDAAGTLKIEPECNYHVGYYSKEVAEAKAHEHSEQVMLGTYELNRAAAGNPWP